MADDTAPSLLTLGWCPGCDTFAAPHTIVTGEYLDQQLGKGRWFGGGPLPALCVYCWKGFYEAGRQADGVDALRALVQGMLGRIQANTEARRRGRAGRELLA